MKSFHMHLLSSHRTLWHLLILVVILILLMISFPDRAHPQSEWEVFTTENSPLLHNYVEAIAVDESGNVWIGTVNGLMRYDDGEWTAFTPDNSDLPGTWVTDIAVDSGNAVWVTTNAGIAVISGDDWTVYTKENTDSGLKNNKTSSVVFDHSGTVWIGTEGSAVCSYDPVSKFWDWYHYDRVPELTGYWINDLHCAPDGTIWVAMKSGAASYNGTSWEHHGPVPTMGPTDVEVRSITSDTSGNTCAITAYGLWKYGGSGWYEESVLNGSEPVEGMQFALFDPICYAITTTAGLAIKDIDIWTFYTADNSQLPHDGVTTLVIGPYRRLWIGTLGGVAVLDITEPVQVTGNNMSVPQPVDLEGCYPNPFNNRTTIAFKVHEPSPLTLTIYSHTGQLIRHINCGTIIPGRTTIVWDGTDDNGAPVSAGVYLYRLGYGSVYGTGRMVLLK